MKQISIFLLLSTLISLTGFSQSTCLLGNNILYQSQIDDFQTDYPGCTIIEGSIQILGEETTNLNGLSVLTEIQGSLLINNAGVESILVTNLTDLTGLNNLTTIGGVLSIGDNTQTNTPLNSFEGLNNLTSIGYDLQISGNESLNDITALSNLTSLGGFLKIQFNDNLTNIQGLNNITSVGGLMLWFNESLSSIEGLEKLDFIGDDGMFIANNPLLVSLTGLEGVISIGGNVSLGQNSALTNLSGLIKVNSIDGDLSISTNAALTNISGLINLTEISRDLVVIDNPLLLNLSGLDNIDATTIEDLWITNNVTLSTCEVQSVCDHLANQNVFTGISGNATGCIDNAEVEQACFIAPPAIVITTQIEIDEFQLNFPDLTETEGDLIIQGDDIDNLNGLGVLTSVGGDLWIGNNINGNPNLTDISGLENLTSVGGGLYIVNNAILTDLSGLGKASTNGLTNITTVGGDLWIAQNASLTDLTGLESITSIGGSFSIYSNPVLSALSGLDNIDPVSIIDLFIFQNDLLSLCEIESVCASLTNPNGAVVVSGNASGCESVEAVLEECVVGIEESKPESGFYIYPNPASDEFFIINSNNIDIKEVKVYNQLGQLVIRKNGINNSINISKLHHGIYIVELISEGLKSRKKLFVR